MRVKKIVLAIDPFIDEADLNAERVVRSVLPFATENDCEVEAVYVMTPAGVGLSLERFPEHQEYFKKLATRMIKIALAGLDKNIETSISVLTLGSNSIRGEIKALLDHVKGSGADLLALTTHGRKGIDRFFLGSFAETLCLKSNVPLLITNPSNPWDATYHRILFATDFEEDSDGLFDQVISVAKRLSAQITLFHRVQPELVIIPPPGFIAAQESKSRRIESEGKALQLKERAERQGIRVEIDLGMENQGVAKAILAAAQRHQPTLMVIGTRNHSDLLAMGSVPRHLLRSAPCPVVVIPQEPMERALENR